MASPLTKRFPRELKNNLGKYLGIFIMMCIAISFTGGFLNAANSIMHLINGMEETYLIEDGRFTTSFEPSDSALRAAADAAAEEETGEATIYSLQSFDVPLLADGTQIATARVYQQRTEVDLAAYCEGRAPETADEIALDRVFCEHNDIAVGTQLEVGGQAFTVCGIMTLPDYSALFEDNTDFVFNALTFTVAEVSPEAFEALSTEHTPAYTYAFTFENTEATVAQRTDAESAMAEALSSHGATVTDLMDKSTNQGIGYPADDVEGDSSMWETLLIMLVVIMAFMFVVLVSSTIEEESAIIGTLMASGWSKREITTHYAMLPCLVGIAAAIVGNILGIFVLTEPMKNLYYNSYSLPPYVGIWDWSVFAKTTLLPLVLLIGITVLGLMRKMRCTPLQFLRHETRRGSARRGMPLPERLGFAVRFRLRVFLTNIGNFITLFFGISFASMLLLFGLCVLPTMSNYAEELRSDVVAEHMYTLKAPLEIDGSASERAAWAAAEEMSELGGITDLMDSDKSTADLLGMAIKALSVDENDVAVNSKENSAEAIAQAEKYAVTTLEYDRGGDHGTETVTVYGIQPNSRYWDDLDIGDGKAYLSAGFFDKFGGSQDMTVSLSDKYEDKTYDVQICGTYGSVSGINLYMGIDDFNELFGNDADYFNGYASDMELALSDYYLASDLTPADMDKIGAQMTNSMGDMMNMLLAIAIMIFVVFMYLLTKTVIDRSARAISYLKVFGYTDREINKLYIRSITATVAVSLVACLPLIIGGLTVIFKNMLMDYSGNILINIPPTAMVETVIAGLLSYALVAAIHIRNIKKVPLEIALKVQE